MQHKLICGLYLLLVVSTAVSANTYRTDSFGTTRDDQGNSWRMDSFGTTCCSDGSVSRTDSFGTTRGSDGSVSRTDRQL